jgi:hypothetical protein
MVDLEKVARFSECFASPPATRRALHHPWMTATAGKLDAEEASGPVPLVGELEPSLRKVGR